MTEVMCPEDECPHNKNEMCTKKIIHLVFDTPAGVSCNEKW